MCCFGPLQITLELDTKLGCCPTKYEGVGSSNDCETKIDECQQRTWVIIRVHILFFNYKKVVRSLEEINVYRCNLASICGHHFLVF